MTRVNLQTATECPTAWFAVLERARADNDFQRAAEAQKQLERLGVKVKYFRQKRKAGGGAR